MNAKMTCTKRAWISDRNAPMGQPSTGRISCPCGNCPPNHYGDGHNVTCPCGIIYTSTGWIVEEPKNV